MERKFIFVRGCARGAGLFLLSGLLFSAHASSLGEGAGAGIEFSGNYAEDGVAVFEPGTKLFSDRGYVLADYPEFLDGTLFLRGSIGSDQFRVAKDGWITVLTPESNEYNSSKIDALEAYGFQRIDDSQVYQLFGKQEWDRVCTYRKEVKAGEKYRFDKWTVVLGFASAKKWEPQAWNENKGELLYNGIRLPKEWPPQNIDPAGTSPMPVPYLDYLPKVIPIDVGRQLFIDDFLVEQTDMERTFHMPKKYEGNPVLKPETPMERGDLPGYEKPYGHGNSGAGPKSGGCWWDPDDQVFKLWYETSWFGPVAMATSKDGLHWERPEFDIRPGSNQVSPLDIVPDSWTVVRNWNATNPAKKWAMYLQPPGLDQPGVALASSDGIHWNRRVKTGSTGDRSTMYYNPFRKKWVYSLRAAFPSRGRARHYYECDDFMKDAQWTDADKVVWTMADELDPPDPYIGDTAQLYNLDAVAYESLMLGMFEIHRGPDNNVCAKAGVPKITELNFAYSRDGFHWDRPDRRAHIPAERKDVWDRGYIQSLGNVCVISGDQLLFYYIGFRGNIDKAGSGNSMYDRSATGVAMLRRDGFASMDVGDDEPRTLTTRLVTFGGKHLFVNVDVPAGALRAEVLDEGGTPIAPFTLANCIPFSGDSTLQNITWQGGADLSGLSGRPVRFRFELANGALYSFWVSRDESGRSDGYVAGGGPGYTGPTDSVGVAALAAEEELGKEM